MWTSCSLSTACSAICCRQRGQNPFYDWGPLKKCAEQLKLILICLFFFWLIKTSCWATFCITPNLLLIHTARLICLQTKKEPESTFLHLITNVITRGVLSKASVSCPLHKCCFGQQQTIKANLENENLHRSLPITPPDHVEVCYIMMQSINQICF